MCLCSSSFLLSFLLLLRSTLFPYPTLFRSRNARADRPSRRERAGDRARSWLRLGGDVRAGVPYALRHERDALAGGWRRALAGAPAAQAEQTTPQRRQSTRAVPGASWAQGGRHEHSRAAAAPLPRRLHALRRTVRAARHPRALGPAHALGRGARGPRE